MKHTPLKLLFFSLGLVIVGFSGCSQTEDPEQKQSRYEEILTRAEQGDAKAQYNLALMYYKGKGVPQDDQEAAKWYRKAAEQGNAKAQNNLGIMYYKGKGIPQNYQAAAKWYRKAAEQGDAKAQYNLGLMYYKGKGTPQNYQKVVKWFCKLAEQGDAKAQYNLGFMYHEGKGVPQNYVQAHMWYNLAAANLTGEVRESAIKSRDLVAKQMTREQIAEAQRLALEFQPK